ncbi:hypothetical protein INR49_012272 [Caranx melampygus]|nr:hypothetical protein INR49_012272 [Caranx melampygus]
MASCTFPSSESKQDKQATSLSLRNSFVPTVSNTFASIRAWQSRAALRRDTSLVQNTTFCISLRNRGVKSTAIMSSSCDVNAFFFYFFRTSDR